MKKRSVKEQVKSGFRLAGVVLLMGAWLGLVFGGMGIAFTPGPYPPFIGWLLLLSAALILLVTMDRWIVVFPGLMGYAIISGILTITEGHLPNYPDAQVARLDAIIMTLLYATAAVVSSTFTNRKLRLTDRVALFAFFFCFFWQAVDRRFWLPIVGLGVMCLVCAWAYDRFKQTRNRSV